MNPDIRVREVRDFESCWPQIWQMMSESITFHATLAGGKPRANISEFAHRYVERFLIGEAALLLAETNDDVLGMAATRVLAPEETGPAASKTGHLADLFVKPEARGRGIGMRLLKAREEWLKSRGVSHVEGVVLVANRIAASLHESAGDVIRGYILRRPLARTTARSEGATPQVRRVKDLEAGWPVIGRLLGTDGEADDSLRTRLEALLGKRGIVLLAGEPSDGIAVANVSINPWILEERVGILHEFRAPDNNPSREAALLAHLESWLISKGATSMQVEATPEEEPRWRSLGFAPFHLRFTKTL